MSVDHEPDLLPVLVEVPMPIITERLRIRSYERADAAELAAVTTASYEHLRPWLPWAKPQQTADEALALIARMISNWALRTDLTMGVFDRTSGELLGGTGLHRMSWSARSFEVGYWLSASAAGRGYMTECVAALTDYAFETLQAQRVEILMDPNNLRSRAIPVRLGFTHEGTKRRTMLDSDGQIRDTDVFSMIRSDRTPEAPRD